MKNKYTLGIELGSTRIKAVLIDENAAVLAQGSYEWENVLTDGFWSYPLESVKEGIQSAYAALAAAYRKQYGEALTELSAIGISAMMHGYLAFDKDDRLLVPFRTWRNTNAAAAAAELSEALSFHIPTRWSISHLYQAVLNGEAHVHDVTHITTLSGYVHYQLTGKRVLGIGDASGVFPVKDGDYDAAMLQKCGELFDARGIHADLADLFPAVLPAGAEAGRLTEDGARWLDPTGTLKAGCPLCPPEGDAGTGMVATNSIAPRTANVSAGTSAFLMAVLEKDLGAWYKEIDIVNTPTGAPVAMVHVNNFASEITAWTNLFAEVIALGGGSLSRGELFDALYAKSREGDGDCGGMMAYSFLAGEPIAGVDKGAPMMARTADGRLTLANFMKAQIYSVLGALSIGIDILRREDVQIASVCGHGGFFKTPFVGQSAMSAAVGAPVTVMKNAGEGGAWGIAVLALFMQRGGGSLACFLDGIFGNAEKITVAADEAERADFARFMQKYKACLAAAKCTGEVL